MRKLLILFSVILCLPQGINSQQTDQPFISSQRGKGKFVISSGGKSSPLLIGSDEWPGVARAFRDLENDIGKVTSAVPLFYSDKAPRSKDLIIAGTIGKSALIDKIIKEKKIDIKGIEGQWETFLIEVVKRPLPGVRRALIIAGSDKRGTIYGIYEISKEIGVSPWYWWADVPVIKKKELFVKTGRFVQGSPSVKYRGIFLNDEAPDLTNWVKEKYGTVALSENPPIPKGVANYGHEFYTKLFELILRLKGNYLWPAMWNNAFNEDDPENPGLADEYGIVMGNSHQEPMLRAQKEWDRRYLKTIGTWNYAKKPDILEAFWREGIRRNKDYESIVTIGLRGANDSEMAPGGPAANMSMLEKIVDVQRKILTDEMNPDITKIPQLWCLYKEVQDYYKAGMRVPDDVTLLWAEDNWGNIRRLPTAEERMRSGGAGIYYHFDYHGGPRSYQWLNTSPVSKIWDQMSLAKQYGADRVWIVNVGHFKGYELPIEYFLDLAWDSKRQTNENINQFTKQWAAGIFGETYSDETARLLEAYTKFNGRRKPELLSPSTYSLVNYREAEKVVEDYKSLALKASDVFNKLPSEMQNAFYQLVLFPVKACSIVNELYLAAGKNDLYFRQHRASTNSMSDETKNLFTADTSLMGYYNRVFAGGKWKHFMDQSHLGYTTWADPPTNNLKAIKLKELVVPDKAAIGVAIEGSEEVWPESRNSPLLPEFDIFNKQGHYIEVFNKGKTAFGFTAVPDKPWIILSQTKGTISKDERLWVKIDWTTLPKGKSAGTIRITGTGKNIAIPVKAFNPEGISPDSLEGFAEGEGVISIEAEHYSNLVSSGENKWIRIEDYGRTLSAMRSCSPVDAAPCTPGKDSPLIEYKMYFFNTGTFDVTSVFSPTLNFISGRPLQYGISFDDEIPQIITLVPENYNAQNRNADWEKSVSDNARLSHSNHIIQKPGYHTLKIFMIDPGVVLEKIIVNSGGLKQSYLGPPGEFLQTGPFQKKNSNLLNLREMKKETKSISRRKFLDTSVKATLLSAVAFRGFPTIVPSSVIGKNPPSDKINIGQIGFGRIASTHDLQETLPFFDLARVVAVADWDSNRAAKGKVFIENFYTRKTGSPGYVDVKTHADYHEILADKSIDAVIISTPDHWHAQPAMEAALAGKDIYVQKPTSLTIKEGQTLRDVVMKKKVILQVGTQQRAMPQFRIAAELVRNGRIGKLETVKIGLPGDPAGPLFPEMPVPKNLNYDAWLGQTSEIFYTENRVHPQNSLNDRPGWLRCEQFGAGMITGWGQHHFDSAAWGMDTELTGPISIEAVADFPKHGTWDVHGDFMAKAVYENGLVMLTSGGYPNGIRYEGTDGWIFVTRGNYTASPSDPGASQRNSKALDASDPAILTSVIKDNEIHLYKIDNQHGNWLECIKSRKEPISPIEKGHRACSICLITHTAMKLERKLPWDPKAEKFGNDAEANKFLSRKQRAPYGTDHVKV